MKQGMNHIYTGDGKGKTTAAFGLAVRAAGRQKSVLIAQFCKGTKSGECDFLQDVPNVAIWHAPCRVGKFFWNMTDAEKRDWLDANRQLFDRAAKAAEDGAFDLIILDEALGAMACGAMAEAELAALMDEKRAACELVLTGRDAPESLIERADYVTEMKLIRHPYEQGVAAREGIEF